MAKQFSMYKKVGENRYRETIGLYHDDLQVGDIYQHRPGRTILESDCVWLSLLTGNKNQLHSDLAYAKKTGKKRLVVPPTVATAFLGMVTATACQKAVANLEFNEVNFYEDLYVGDTIYGTTELISKRDSKSRPHCGIMKIKHAIYRDSDNRLILDCTHTFISTYRGYCLDDEIDY